ASGDILRRNTQQDPSIVKAILECKASGNAITTMHTLCTYQLYRSRRPMRDESNHLLQSSGQGGGFHARVDMSFNVIDVALTQLVHVLLCQRLILSPRELLDQVLPAARGG